MKLDPAVTELLGLDPENTTLSSAGGGGCSSASTWKITSKRGDGTQKMYFMKTGRGSEAEVMFEGEHASLNALHNAVPTLAPQSYGHGSFASSPSTSFLVTDYLHLTSRRAKKSSNSGSDASSPRPLTLAEKLAKLHSTPAPVPDGHSAPVFGFPATTCCGDTPQDNGYKASWADFYAENRLRFILRRAEAANGRDGELRDLVEKTAARVVPRLLGDAHLNGGRGVVPVVVHGDLWSGNASTGVMASMSASSSSEAELDSDPEPEDVVYDPSACYAHSEYELGIMNMFGGFGAAFFAEYHARVPKAEPVAEYADRVRLYELYHHLNHYALFGGGYRGGAVGIMTALVRKYG